MSNDIFNLNQFFNEQIENFVIVENSCEEQTNNLQVASSKAQGVSGGFSASPNQQMLKKSMPNLNNFSNISYANTSQDTGLALKMHQAVQETGKGEEL